MGMLRSMVIDHCMLKLMVKTSKGIWTLTPSELVPKIIMAQGHESNQ